MTAGQREREKKREDIRQLTGKKGEKETTGFLRNSGRWRRENVNGLGFYGISSGVNSLAARN